MTQAIVSPEYLRKVLRYDANTGKLYWLRRNMEQWTACAASCARWNGRYAEREAFTAEKARGYLHGSLMGKQFSAHRVVWALWYGSWPSLHVDHIDGNTGNNRIENLREATRSQNMRNSRSAKGSTSPFLGVSWKSECKKWCAQIQMADGKKHLGYFCDELDAAKAYDAAAFAHSGAFARLNFPASKAVA